MCRLCCIFFRRRWQTTFTSLCFNANHMGRMIYDLCRVFSNYVIYKIALFSLVSNVYCFLCFESRIPIVYPSWSATSSRKMYNSRLKYKRKIPAITSCRFIDVTNGREERQGKSWIVNVSMRLHYICFSRTNPHDGESLEGWGPKLEGQSPQYRFLPRQAKFFILSKWI